MRYDFDQVSDRRNSDCLKYDALEHYFGKKEIQPLWVADMDFKTPSFVLDAIIAKTQQGFLGYPYNNQRALDSIQDWMLKRHHWKISMDEILLTNGVVASLSAAIEAFSDEGDEVIIQPPVYPPFYKVIHHNQRTIIENPLNNDNGYYEMDLDDLKQKITPRTKLLILCSPHNPVGRVWSQTELEALSRLCLEHNIMLLSDEIHSDIVYTAFTPLASICPEIANNSVTFNSPSKTFNMAGLNSAYVIVPNSKLRKKYQRVLMQRETHTLNMFGPLAIQHAYDQGEEWLEQLLSYLSGNIQMVRSFFDRYELPISFDVPQGTYLLWLDFSHYEWEHETVKQTLIHKARIGLNDGLSFNKKSDNYFRMNIALPQRLLESALINIRDNFRT